MTKDTNETIEQTEEDDINHIDPLLSDFKNMNVNKMKQNKKLKNKIEKSIKEYKHVIENIDVLFRSGIHTDMEIRDKIKETEGKIFALYWILDQLETKKQERTTNETIDFSWFGTHISMDPQKGTLKKKTSDYEGCKSYITDC
jgi:ferritin-like metal-binding protein YciE